MGSIFIVPNHDRPPQKTFTIDQGVQVFPPFSTSHANHNVASGNFSELIFVYLDIISPRRVGNDLIRALKIIPYDGTNVLRFDNVEYIPVERAYYDSISVQICDSTGNLLDFNDSSLPTYIQLHFKKLSE